MNLDKRIRYYKAYLEDLIHTVKEDKEIKNIKDLERESFIQNIIDAFSVRGSIEKYFKKTYLKEDLLLFLSTIKHCLDGGNIIKKEVYTNTEIN